MPTPDSSEISNRLPTAALWLITACAFALRFYHLDTPSLWGDEILLPLTAQQPLTYILNWIAQLEVHPPYIYLLVKAIMAAGKSDFALRFLFALCGVASIPLIYRVGARLFSPGAGMAAAAFLALNSLHIYLSRVVRPYSIMILIFLVAFDRFQRYLEDRSGRNLAILTVLNALLLSLHYAAIFVIASMFAVLAWKFLRRQGVALADMIRFSLASCLSFLPVVWFLVMSMRLKGGGAGMFPIKAFLEKYLFCATAQLNTFYPDAVTYALLPFFFLGLFVLYRNYRDKFATFLLFLLVPFLMLLLLRHGYHLTPWHISVFLPVFLFPCALGAVFLLRDVRTAAVAAGIATLTGTTLLLVLWAGPFFTRIANNGQYKGLARTIPEAVAPGSVTVIDQFLFHAANWYLAQFAARNPLVEQSLDAGGRTCRVNVVTDAAGSIGHAFGTERELFMRFGQPLKTIAVGGLRIHCFELARTPVITGAGLPMRRSLHVDPAGFYESAFAASKIMINPFWKFGVIPTSNYSPGVLSYALDNPAESYPQRIRFKMKYSLEGEGVRLTMKALFDDEPAQTVLNLTGPGTGNFSQGGVAEAEIDLRRDAPYKRLILDIEMLCPLITAKYDGGNLDAVRFGGAELRVDRIDTDLFDPSTLEKSIAVENIGGVEDSPEGNWRWGFGSESAIRFELPADKPVTLSYAFTNPIPGQEAIILANGEEIARLSGLEAQKWLTEAHEGRISFAGKRGENAILFRFADHNHGKTSFAPGDPSLYNVAFTRLRLDY